MIEITIHNWNEYIDPRALRGEHPWWFRADATIIQRGIWDELTMSDAGLFYFLCSYMTLNAPRSGQTMVKKRLLRDRTRLRLDRVWSTLGKLQTCGLLSYRIVTEESGPHLDPRLDKIRGEEIREEKAVLSSLNKPSSESLENVAKSITPVSNDWEGQKQRQLIEQFRNSPEYRKLEHLSQAIKSFAPES